MVDLEMSPFPNPSGQQAPKFKMSARAQLGRLRNGSFYAGILNVRNRKTLRKHMCFCGGLLEDVREDVGPSYFQ